MIVAGVMSGTSADGIDVALVEMGNQKLSASSKQASQESPASLQLLAHSHFPYPAAVRSTVLALMNAKCASVADIARLNFLLGELYADAVLATQRKLRRHVELVGCHGQTIYHQGEPIWFLGKRLAVTWQVGEGSRIASRVGVPVISDFRPADMAAGGKGAPLVPYLDYLLYRDPTMGRIALNIGGIANLTAIAANAPLGQVLAFDTGPGNMAIDALTEQLFGRPYDREGRIAARGRVLDDVLAHYLAQPYFRRKPPKTAGREEFGREFAEIIRRACGSQAFKRVQQLGVREPTKSTGKGSRPDNADVIATATALTAVSIADAIQRFVSPLGAFSELIASGGGTKNSTLMKQLADAVRPLGLRLRTSDDFGVPPEAKEAVAFAVLAYQTWHRKPSNVPSATGAKTQAVLGKVSYP